VKTLIERIQDNDPMFLPLHRAISRLTVDDVPGYRAARARFIFDPDDCSRPLPLLDYVRDEWARVYWAEQDGRRPYDVATSLDVLAAVSDAIEPYQELVYVGDDDDGESVYEEREMASAADIRRALFCDLVWAGPMCR
jgi:hypothetical protein